MGLSAVSLLKQNSDSSTWIGLSHYFLSHSSILRKISSPSHRYLSCSVCCAAWFHCLNDTELTEIFTGVYFSCYFVKDRWKKRWFQVGLTHTSTPYCWLMIKKQEIAIEKWQVCCLLESEVTEMWRQLTEEVKNWVEDNHWNQKCVSQVQSDRKCAQQLLL